MVEVCEDFNIREWIPKSGDMVTLPKREFLNIINQLMLAEQLIMEDGICYNKPNFKCIKVDLLFRLYEKISNKPLPEPIVMIENSFKSDQEYKAKRETLKLLKHINVV